MSEVKSNKGENATRLQASQYICSEFYIAIGCIVLGCIFLAWLFYIATQSVTDLTIGGKIGEIFALAFYSIFAIISFVAGIWGINQLNSPLVKEEIDFAERFDFNEAGKNVLRASLESGGVLKKIHLSRALRAHYRQVGQEEQALLKQKNENLARKFREEHALPTQKNECIDRKFSA